MATLALNKMKSKLATRNNFTGRAMERMTKEKLQNLFDGEMNYLSWEQTYIQRRFHPGEHLTKIRNMRRAIFEKEKRKHLNDTNESLINLTEMLETEEQHDLATQQRFNRFITRHNGSKPLLALDVDNTLIYVRFFSEELQIGDICTYFGDYLCVEQSNSTVLKVRLTISLEVTNNTLIDVLGSERVDHFHWCSSNQESRRYSKNAMFEYPLNTNKTVDFIQCRIRKVEISGCIIQVFNNDIREEIEIDFTESNDNLNRFEPQLEREGMLSVDFIYEGFLVRVRPNLDEFMEYINDDFDVCIYTSANKVIYEGLMKQLHLFINETLGREDPVWNDEIYRDDCILRYKANGKPYHHKDLSLFGCDLSRVIMMDNSPIVLEGQEPNLILISDFFGKDDADDELMEVYQLLDAIRCVKGDIRYFLCGLEDEKHLFESVDVSTQQSCLDLTQQLITAMKAYYNEEMNVFGTDSQHIIADNDNMMDDYDEDDVKNESIFAQAKNHTLTPLQVEVILDDLELNKTGSVNEFDTQQVYDEAFVLDMTEITHRDRTGSAFIPPKHSKNDSMVSVRDLDVIKQEKQNKRRVLFDENTNFVNSGKAVATPTRRRKRRQSSVVNSMAPKPSSRAILQNSNHEDFFVSFLQQWTLKDNEEEYMDMDEMRELQNEIQELQRINVQKSKEMEMCLNNEKEYILLIETLEKDIKMYKDMVQLEAVNKRLSGELQQVNENISIITNDKDTLQLHINHVIQSKIELIKTANTEIDRYRQLMRQIANKNVNISFQ